MATTPATTTAAASAATAASASSATSVGITTDIGAVANLATEVVKSIETLQTEANTPAMVAAKMAEDQNKVDMAIDKAIVTNDQAAIKEIASGN